MSGRIVIVGGPRCGKSWLARALTAETGAPRFCGDPLTKVKEPLAGVTYLPEHVPIADSYEGANDGAAAWIAEHWFGDMEGPWICEGWVMARALRRWIRERSEIEEARPGLAINAFPCERVIVFEKPREDQDLLRGQSSMHLGVMKVWSQVRNYYEPITEYRT